MELNKFDDMDDFQILRATRVKLAFSFTGVETIASVDSRQEVSSNSTPIQSSNSALVPASDLFSVSPSRQGGPVDAENCNDVIVRLPAGTPSPDKKDGEAPVNLVGSTAVALATVRSAASTLRARGPTSTVSDPRIYDYNVARTGPEHCTLRSDLHRSEKKTFISPICSKHFKNQLHK